MPALNSKAISKNQVRYIQALRRRKGICDADYKAMKESVGAASTTELTVGQFEELLARIEGKNRPAEGGSGKGKRSWKPVHHSAYRSGMHKKPPADKEAMIRKIEAILTELELPWSYADGMAKKMTAGRVERLRFLDVEQTYKVLQMLCVHQKRRREKEKR